MALLYANFKDFNFYVWLVYKECNTFEQRLKWFAFLSFRFKMSVNECNC